MPPPSQLLKLKAKQKPTKVKLGYKLGGGNEDTTEIDFVFVRGDGDCGLHSLSEGLGDPKLVNDIREKFTGEQTNIGYHWNSEQLAEIAAHYGKGVISFEGTLDRQGSRVVIRTLLLTTILRIILTITSSLLMSQGCTGTTLHLVMLVIKQQIKSNR